MKTSNINRARLNTAADLHLDAHGALSTAPLRVAEACSPAFAKPH